MQEKRKEERVLLHNPFAEYWNSFEIGSGYLACKLRTFKHKKA